MPLRFLPLLLLVAVAASGCRGMKSDETPIHPNLNMDFQEKFEAQEKNTFFEDQAAMRQPVAGTVARGQLRTTDNAPFEYGRTASGAYVPQIPLQVTEALVERGQERYDIFCSVCHGGSGDGQGIIMVGNAGQGYGYTPAPTYHSDYLRDIEDGYLYGVIANGVRSMPSYGHEMPPADRWAIVAYIRALQRSQNADAADIPAEQRDRVASEYVGSN
ncbi:c-type cytochrome [Rubricoccus marinus]|uniref:Quinol:cytochrome C oxidoreductase n=1 Tax=Rubricoccus marinus TaxID=716817 RepID=A0A259U075_9BACT|nr:cytochrome c [Rubricoccus marinus]OZC03238.1 quinol:cytochrome C oxidoreductase [Rubricoccus marinus]